jgi:hypothetical protein
VVTLDDIAMLIIDRREDSMNADGIVNFGCRFNGNAKKPVMMDLRQWHGVNIGVLADRAHVEPSIIYCMLLSRPVECFNAVSVLEGISKLVGVNYTLDDVDITLLEEVEDSRNC